MTESSQEIDLPNKRPNLPKPSPFHITELQQDRGLWCFWLTADPDVLYFVQNLNCIIMPPSSSAPFGRDLEGRVMFAVNPRYNHEETWLWLHEVLDSEANRVELNDDWEDAIRDAKVWSDEM